jgi:hypothetical protein
VHPRLDRAVGWRRRDKFLDGRAWAWHRSGRSWRRVRAHLNRQERRADFYSRALRRQQARDYARVRARQLDNGFGGLDLDDDLVECHGVTGLDVPLDDIRLSQALADVSQPEFFQL